MAVDHKLVHQAIACAARFRADESLEEYLQLLQNGMDQAKKLLEKHQLKADERSLPTVRFLFMSIEMLKLLATSPEDTSITNLISIQEQAKIKILLQLIFSLGLLPSLVKGVNIPLATKTKQLNLLITEKRSIVQSYNVVQHTARELLNLLKSPNLRSLILCHLGDLMSALLQLIYCGTIKKPVKDGTNSENDDADSERFVMTESWYALLTKHRQEFTTAYRELVDGIYKPLVIRELLILLMPCKSKELVPPKWLERAITQQLTGYLISPGGVSLTMRACCPSNSETVEWKKVDSMAKLISVVHSNMDPDEFYALISPQVISLLNTTGTYCLPVAKMCIKKFYQRDPTRCNKYIFDKLFEPFIICSKPINENFNGTLISEDSMSRCIDHINKCFTPGSKESALPFKALIKIIKIKFRLYIKIAGSPFQHQLAVQDLLIRFLHTETDPKKLELIYNALMFNEPHPDMLDMNDELEFEFGPSGGIQVVKRLPKDSVSFTMTEGGCFRSQFEHYCESLLDLLAQSEFYSKKLLYDLFVVLLTSLTTLFEEDTDVLDFNPELLYTDEVLCRIIMKKEKKLMTVKLLADLSENVWVMQSIEEAPELMLKFIQSLIEAKSANLTEKAEDTDDDERSDVIMISLRVIDIMTMNLKPLSDGWKSFKPLLSPLQNLKDNFPVEYVRMMSALVHERLLTHGVVNDNYYVKDTNRRKAKIPKAKGEFLRKKADCKDQKNAVDSVMAMLCDEDVPAIGHGLIELEKLIRKGSPEIIARKEEVFLTLKHHLNDPDSYVYLAAINALESMCHINSGMVIEYLCEEYCSNKKDCSNLQLKIGEVLVRITKALSDLGPTNKTRLVNTFLFGTKSEDEFLRASSLSNLGEVLKNFGYSLGSVLQEVFICVKCIALTDKSDIVRRAAILLVHNLIKGYSGPSFIGLQQVIKDFFRLLIQVYRFDKDDVVKGHAEAALLEVNSFLEFKQFKSRTLEKKISILDFNQPFV